MVSLTPREERFPKIKLPVESNTAENPSQMKTEIVYSSR